MSAAHCLTSDPVLRQLLKAFTRCKELGALAQVHAENGDLIAAVSSYLLSAAATFSLPSSPLASNLRR